MITVSHLTKRFDDVVALDDLNLSVQDGEIIVILGPSGSGKSVFLKHLIGLYRPDSGRVEIDHVNILELPEKELLKIRRNIGYLFQEGALFDFMTVYENLAFPLEEHSELKEQAIRQKVREMLPLVGLEGADNKYPVELSGGMKKRAALARAMMLDTRYLFCDEPTSGLDPFRSHDISNLIVYMVRRFACTAIITSHDIANSLRIADRLAIIHEGRFLFVGTKDELLRSRDPWIKDFLNP